MTAQKDAPYPPYASCLKLNGNKPVSYFYNEEEFSPHTIKEATQLSSDEFLSRIMVEVSKKEKHSINFDF
jgi:hypothetical protein